MASYLKCLGLLRVVGRQADSGARGRWQAGRFELASELEEEAFRRFLLDDYEPTPIVSPWNGGSGFFPKDRTEPLDAIVASEQPRFAAYGEVIEAARGVLARRGLVDKPAGQAKLALVHELRRTLPDEALQWLDTAIVLTGLEVGFPPLLGSGGNDGRFDFANNYARAVAALLCEGGERRSRAPELLDASLDATPVALERKLSLAHFLRDASPVNSPAGEADSLGNPWDLVLGLEGALVFCAGAARRHGRGISAQLVAPFTAQPSAAGYGSALPGERGRAELWLPLWGGWATLPELEALASEARAQVGRRGARTGLDFARAAGELGVARGIFGFERYAIMERAGQSSLAVPAGRIAVRPRPAVRAIRPLDDWLRGVLRHARAGGGASRSVAVTAGAIERALFAFADEPSASRAGVALERLGALESALARSASRSLEGGLRPLARAAAAPWLEAADDGSPEFAVAASIASLRDSTGRLPRLRDYLHGTMSDERGASVFDRERRWLISGSASAVTRLAAVHARRHLDAARARDRDGPAPLGFARGLPCDAAALHAFALGRLDDERIVRLVGGLCLLDFGGARRSAAHRVGSPPCPALDLLVVSWQGLPGAQLGPRPGAAARLAAGRTASVLGEAVLRLRMADLPPLLEASDLGLGAPPGPRLSAALLARVSEPERGAMARRLGIVPTKADAETKEAM